MKTKPMPSLILFIIFCSFSQIISNNGLNHINGRNDLHDHKKKTVEGDLLSIKGKGVVCNKLKVGGNVCVDHQLLFNNQQCDSISFAKGAQEKNLLNLRATVCLACNPGLSCSLNNDCIITNPPAVGCLNLTSSLCQNRTKVCSGKGIAVKKASVTISGSSCSTQISIVDNAQASLTTNIQVELCIPLHFCITFCDRPTLQATYDDSSGNLTRTSCIQDRLIGNDQNFPCNFLGHSVTTFLGAKIHIQNISHHNALLKFTLLYQNCIGLSSPDCLFELFQKTCIEQKNAVEDICKHANTVLASACFDINAEGRVL